MPAKLEKAAPDAQILALQEEALEHWLATGVPSQKDEAFTYFPARRLKDIDWTSLPLALDDSHLAGVPAPLLQAESEIRFVFVNGHYLPQLSNTRTPQGLQVASLGAMRMQENGWLAEHFGALGDTKQHPFLALNTAYCKDGVVIHVQKDVKVEPVIELIFHTQGTDKMGAKPQVTYPRVLIVLEEGAEATVLAHHSGYGVSVRVMAYEMSVADNAKLHHYRLQDMPAAATHITTSLIRTGNDSSYDGFTLTTGAGLSRNDIHGVLDGENSELRVNGAYLLSGRQHSETAILIDHLKENGVSNQLYKGILDDYARGVFQGKIYVERGAQKTDGYQLHNAMMLSERSEVDCKPELEIYADDVRCSHGATTGRIDEGPLFYLRSRGITETSARLILMQAFLAEAMQEIRDDNIRSLLMGRAAMWLRRHIGK